MPGRYVRAILTFALTNDDGRRAGDTIRNVLAIDSLSSGFNTTHRSHCLNKSHMFKLTITFVEKTND